jgi:von Willebrand factor type A domain
MEKNLNAAVLNRDYTIIIDSSGSMGDPVGNGDVRSRWESVRESSVAVGRKINEFDSDGITLYTFSDKFKRFDNVGPDKIDEIFNKSDPVGSTALHSVLHHAFEDYFKRRDKGQAKSNGESFFVVTDGKPDDEQAVVREIVSATKRVNHAKELSLTFLQVGDDPHASSFLQKLDDELEPAGAKHDIVDTISFDKLSGRNLTDVVTAAITEHKQAV